MKQLVHGGDWMGYRERFGRDALDFSANVSPLGLPEGVAQAIRDALPLADRYPDPLCRTLRAALSRAEGVPQEHVLCGNGAADLIFRLVWAVKPHKALVTAPTFAEYASALDTVGCEVKRFFLDETNDFAPTDALVDAVDESIDLVFLCQPNNPTGQLASPELVKKLLRRCGECRTILAVDECFLDFLPDADGWTAKPLLESGNLVILKAFTKLYGMAGVRLGYCLCGDETLLEKMQTAGQPWAVSSLAQAAGVAALKETAYVDEVRALIARQRPVLAAGLRALPFANIEYLECTHHVVHFHLASGEDVPSLSVRVPFAQVAQPLLADERFVQLHRSYVVNLAAVSQLAAGEFWMQSGARVPVPRGREPAARTALKDYLEKQFR